MSFEDDVQRTSVQRTSECIEQVAIALHSVQGKDVEIQLEIDRVYSPFWVRFDRVTGAEVPFSVWCSQTSRLFGA